MKRVLERTGYFAVVSSLYPLAPWSYTRAILNAVPDGELRASVRLFLLGEKVSAEELPKELFDLLPNLSSLGILHKVGVSHFHAGPLALMKNMGVTFFFERPNPKMHLYFGSESVALAHRLEVESTDVVLDVCAGPGFQTLVIAKKVNRVIAVEINPAAVGMLEYNLVLNELSNVTVICSDFDRLDLDQRVDVVIANPPLVPVPSGLPFAFVGDGGSDGLNVTRKILKRLGDWLTDEGRLHLVGFSYPIVPDGQLDEVLLASCGTTMDMLLTVSGRFPYGPEDPMFNMMAHSIAAMSDQDLPEIKIRLEHETRDLPVKELLCFLLRGERSSSPKMRTLDFGRTSYGGWFV
jgi:SAM-dependent methyltransferase